MTIKTKVEGKKPYAYEFHELEPPDVTWSPHCLAFALIAFAAIVAVLALPIAALFRLIHG